MSFDISKLFSAQLGEQQYNKRVSDARKRTPSPLSPNRAQVERLFAAADTTGAKRTIAHADGGRAIPIDQAAPNLQKGLMKTFGRLVA